MTIWYDNFDSTFFLTIGTLAFGFLGLVIRNCYKSKCSSIEIGCIKIIRDVEEEEKIDELAVQHHNSENKEEV